ncbi:MAG: esterase [Pedobacter sp.]|nr:esterase [Pedobacter sp.]
MKKLILILILTATLVSCGKNPIIEDSTLDSGFFFDQSIYMPAKYLVSISKPQPNAVEKGKSVIIAIHGYGATTFEWDEFRTWAGSRTDFSISQVLLGGHGRAYQTFKDSSWEDWRQPIINEFETLEKQGYTNISFAGSSTGCTLILEMLASGYFKAHIKPSHIFLIDPIIIPAEKTLSLVGVLGPIIGYTSVENTAGEEKYYYHYRPYETLKELKNVIGKVRKDLEKGFKLPQNCTLNIYKSDKDNVADAVSAVLIYKGLKTFEGNAINVSMISSNLHVFTRLGGRKAVPSEKDLNNRNQTFSDIASIVNEKP